MVGRGGTIDYGLEMFKARSLHHCCSCVNYIRQCYQGRETMTELENRPCAINGRLTIVLIHTMYEW